MPEFESKCLNQKYTFDFISCRLSRFNNQDYKREPSHIILEMVPSKYRFVITSTELCQGYNKDSSFTRNVHGF